MVLYIRTKEKRESKKKIKKVLTFSYFYGTISTTRQGKVVKTRKRGKLYGKNRYDNKRVP